MLGRDEVRDLSLWATGGLLPDLTVLLDLDPASARDRLDADDKPFDRLESEQDDFHARVRAEFLALAAAEPERFLVLDASRSPADLGDRHPGARPGAPRRWPRPARVGAAD